MKLHNILSNLNFQYGCEIAAKLSDIRNVGSKQGFKNAGSTGEKKAAQYIENEMKRIGLKNITKEYFPVDVWEYKGATLNVITDKSEKKTYELSAFAGSIGTGRTLLEANIVDAGHGFYCECKKAEVKGAIAFIRMNLDGDFWIGVPAYQLELMGASAVIMVLEGSSYGVNEEALNSANASVRPTIPILNISREAARELENMLKKGEVKGSLMADITIKRGSSCNVIGEISGKKQNQYILLGAHYDSYFNAYIDDAFGIGALLNIARAITLSRGTPQFSIRFIAHGAEEFGICNSHYDWCIGSWQQVTNLRPEWAEEIKLFLNIDAVLPDADQLLVQAAPQLHSFLKKCLIKGEDEIKTFWEKGWVIKDINGTWSDDFNYYIKGIPVFMAGRGETKWKEKYYHTNFDSKKQIYQELMKEISQIYSRVLCEYTTAERCLVEISEELYLFEKALNKSILEEANVKTEALFREIRKLKEKIKAKTFEKKEYKEIDDYLTQVNRKLIATVRAVDFDDNVIFRSQTMQRNLVVLNDLQEATEKGNIKKAFELIKMLPGSIAAECFQKEVYEYWYVDAVDSEKCQLQWGDKMIEPPLNLWNLTTKLIGVDCHKAHIGEVLDEIEALKEREKERLKICIRWLTKHLQKINNI